MGRLKSFMLDRSGATALEYCLIAMMISVAAIGGFRAISGSLNNTFAIVENTLAEE